MQNCNIPNFAKHIPILFSPPSWTIFLTKVIFLKESQLEVINARVDAWTIHSSQNYIRKWVFTIKSPRSFQKFLLLQIILFEKMFYTKIIIYCTIKHIEPFPHLLPFHLVLHTRLFISLKVLAIMPWFTFKCFLKSYYSIGLVICY